MRTLTARDKAARWLDLLAYLLQHRFPVTREEIYAHVAAYRDEADAATDDKARESLRRKFERDKDELRTLGITIETVSLGQHSGDEANTGYRLPARDFYLPYLELGGRDAEHAYAGLARILIVKEDVATLDRATARVAQSGLPALAAAAASARRKLEFDLPLPVRAVERVLSRPLTGEAAEALEVLQRAVAERTAVRCRYFAIGRDTEEVRLLEPYGLFFSWGRWYVVAWARERQAMRVFRVDRVRDAELLKGKDATFEVPDGFSIRAYVGRAPWELSETPPITVRVRFEFPESRWVLAQGVGDAVDDLLEDGGAVLAFGVRDVQPFLRWLLTFRGRVHVLEPVTMAHELDALRRKVAALYTEGR
jgi:predicted DNA-binding transcriptional regulator YafY